MMFRLSFLALLVLQDVRAAPFSPRILYRRDDAKLTMRETKAFAPPADLNTAENVADLKEIGTSPRSSRGM